MFTGIIEEIGRIKDIHKNRNSMKITISAGTVLQDVKNGDSIAVNGVCLTVTDFTAAAFTADIMHETVSRTTFSAMKKGDFVNLERAMRANSRFGGHIVSGHIDGIGTIRNVQKEGISLWYTIQAAPDIMRYVIEKGSVAIDGVSLTIAKTQADTFRVSVIPHTLKQTAFIHKTAGDAVNLENDCIGKYVEKLLGGNAPFSSGITKEFLVKYGY